MSNHRPPNAQATATSSHERSRRPEPPSYQPQQLEHQPQGLYNFTIPNASAPPFPVPQTQYPSRSFPRADVTGEELKFDSYGGDQFPYSEAYNGYSYPGFVPAYDPQQGDQDRSKMYSYMYASSDRPDSFLQPRMPPPMERANPYAGTVSPPAFFQHQEAAQRSQMEVPLHMNYGPPPMPGRYNPAASRSRTLRPRGDIPSLQEQDTRKSDKPAQMNMPYNMQEPRQEALATPKVEVVQRNCCLCMEGGSDHTAQPCGHHFHDRCLRSWNSHACPVCSQMAQAMGSMPESSIPMSTDRSVSRLNRNKAGLIGKANLEATAAPVKPSSRRGQKKHKSCSVAGCNRTVRSKGLCKGHGGGRRCGAQGCGLSDQGGGFCISHGGGKRCIKEGCSNSAQSRGLCKLHGGGSRCTVEGCAKSSQGNGLCRAHGGGRRCRVEGCNKTDRRAGFCVTHGADRKCLVPECSKTGKMEHLCTKHYYEKYNSVAPSHETWSEASSENRMNAVNTPTLYGVADRLNEGMKQTEGQTSEF